MHSNATIMMFFLFVLFIVIGIYLINNYTSTKIYTSIYSI